MRDLFSASIRLRRPWRICCGSVDSLYDNRPGDVAVAGRIAALWGRIMIFGADSCIFVFIDVTIL